MTSGSIVLRAGAAVAVVVCALASAGASLGAQGRAAERPPAPGALPTDRRVSPGEVQSMFDAYTLLQAQEVLQLEDDQYARFVTRLRALQAARRRGESQKMTIVNQLRRILQAAGGRVDESMIKDRLKMLSDLDASVAAEVKTAQASLDEVLDLRQQARFRIFEEEMERRKIELVMRIRQSNRPQANRPGRDFQN
jgi:hypothetical protein